MCEGLIIVMTILLLKTMSNKAGLVTLERVIGPSLDLINPLVRDGTIMRRKRNKIPRASVLKSNDLLSHGVLPFRMTNGIMVCGPLRKKSTGKTIPVCRLQRSSNLKISE
jgi:hypothetical protein